jgi:hypothetical protein
MHDEVGDKEQNKNGRTQCRFKKVGFSLVVIKINDKKMESRKFNNQK